MAGWLALRNTSVFEPTENLPKRLFDSVNFYSRTDCGLCDEALEILDEFSQHFPEIQMIDIDQNRARRDEFTDCVPVVEIDGRVMFRGKINRELLVRLITAKQRQVGLAVESMPEHIE